MRYLSATQLHDGRRFQPAGTVLAVHEDGRVHGLVPAGDVSDFESFKGILCPGFINAHTHLELSHLSGLVAQGTGLVPFLKTVVQLRGQHSDAERRAARNAACAQMAEAGIVAIGDVCNTLDTLDVRAEGRLHIHSFIECAGVRPEAAPIKWRQAQEVYAHFANQPSAKGLLRQSIVPHAPYSVSEPLMRQIGQAQGNALLSIHNQEAEAENTLFALGSGAFVPFLAGFGANVAAYQPSGKPSLQTYMHWLSPNQSIILVHNTYSSTHDVEAAAAYFGPQLSLCLCPNANWYIERRLPDVAMLAQGPWRLCIGTDSLASNTTLSILSELHRIHMAFPTIGWEILLRWATLHGAEALQMEAVLGSFEAGKTPGVVLLRPVDSDYEPCRIL